MKPADWRNCSTMRHPVQIPFTSQDWNCLLLQTLRILGLSHHVSHRMVALPCTPTHPELPVFLSAFGHFSVAFPALQIWILKILKMVKVK